MIKKIYLLLTIFLLFISYSVNADVVTPKTIEKMDTQEFAFIDNTGYEIESIDNVLATVIKAFLSLLGIIFVILIILAGYNWMTAAGEEEKVNKAKDTLKRAIIGLIIVASAYAITYFVFTNLPGGDGGPTAY